ncbi:MAG: S41 family peptidase [Chloroflexi bacterium]|nr:S41 family peptidase [Chloroflexota bacterium]
MRLRLLLLPLLLFSLSCRAASRLLTPAEAQSSPTLPPTLTWTVTATVTPPPPTPTATPTPEPTPTATPLPPSPTLTATAPPGDKALHLRVFEELWQIVDEQYLYPDFNGLDWGQAGDDFRQKIEGGLSDPDFYYGMAVLVFRLGDDHSVFLSPAEASHEDAEFAGENDYVGIGVLSLAVPERQRVTIILVFPSGPAEQAGLQPHDNILAVDGRPIFDENGARMDLLRGPADSQITLDVQTPGGPARQVQVTRQQVGGSLPAPYWALTSPQGRRVGYILIASFADDAMNEQVRAAIETLSADGPLDGLILDNRQNGGGAESVTKDILGYFTHGTLGYFSDRAGRRRGFNVLGSDVSGSSTVPLVVLVGSESASFGEIFSGVLQDSGRAALIGEPTGGNVELLWGYEFDDGSRAWIAHESFRPRQNPQTDWETDGLIPDLLAPANWDEITIETDPAVQAALDYFDQKSAVQ